VTADQQLTLGDCEPEWADVLAAAELHDPVDPRWRDLRHQGLTAQQYARIVDVTVVGDYL
jgi:hypothetical protein